MRNLLFASLLLALTGALACGGDATVETADSEQTTGDDELMVTDPAGVDTLVDPDNPEAYDDLASKLSEMEQRVDMGEHFEREEVGGVPGRRLVLRGAVLETWEFPTAAEARQFAGRFSEDGRMFDGEPLPWMTTTHLWIYGRVVVMYQGAEGHVLAVMDEIAQTRSDHAEGDHQHSAEEVEQIVRGQVSARLSLPPGTLRLVSRERVTFSTSCLDVPGGNTTCNQVETPGWRMVFMNGEERIVAHADLSAARVFFPGQSE